VAEEEKKDEKKEDDFPPRPSSVAREIDGDEYATNSAQISRGSHQNRFVLGSLIHKGKK
jgi:hypothetical protein